MLQGLLDASVLVYPVVSLAAVEATKRKMMKMMSLQVKRKKMMWRVTLAM